MIFLAQACVSFALDPTKSVYFHQHQHWTIEDGLPMNSVLAITQTPDGYLWLGTEMGLVRFDGVHFELLNRDNTPAFTNNLVICLEVDRQGTLWIGTRGGGVIRYKNNRFDNISRKDGLAGDSVWVLEAAADGSIWIGTHKGLNRFGNGKLSTIPLPDAQANFYVKALMEDRIGRMWVGTRGGGVCIVNKKGDGFEAYCKGLQGAKVSAILQDRDGTIWIATLESGVFSLRGNTLTQISKQQGLSHNYVNCLHEDRDGNLWIGTYGSGINVLQKGSREITILNEETGLGSNVILRFHEDREGTLWFGTEGGGLNSLRNTRITTYTRNNGLSNNIVMGVFQDSAGRIWCGTHGFGINCLQPETGEITVYTTSDGLANDLCTSIAEYPPAGGTIWIGTMGGGISRLQTDTKQFTTFSTKQGLQENFVRALYVDPDGNLWAGTDNGGVHRFNDHRFQLERNVHSRVNAMCKDTHGNLWVGTFDSGLHCLAPDGSCTIYNETNGFYGKIAMGLYEDSTGLLWIGTSHDGLFYFRNGTFGNIHKKEGLPDSTAYCILEDKNSNLWVSSNHGIYSLSRKEIQQFTSGGISRFVPTEYGTDDGMRSMECNGGSQPAGWRSRDGRLWFPTTRGVSVIDPENMGLNPLPPPVRVVHAVCNGIALTPTEPAGTNASTRSIPPGSGNIEFEYTALSFIVPQKIQFKTKLLGWDRQWVQAGDRRRATYANLPPGHYTFKVGACNSDGIWNHTDDSFSFYLQPRFYQTVEFKIILPLSIILFCLLIYHQGKRFLVLKLVPKKYKRSALTEDKSSVYLRKAMFQVEEKKIYRDPNVSLKTLSSQLMISPRTLSQVINEQLKRNFFDLINQYRIEEAQMLLTEPGAGDRSILDIGYEVGFNSKSAFNRAFKKITQMTPSQYRKQNKSADS
ncbi:MAG: helix-turn-helix domain-containing protein [bacterium]|nr:helix-turn-helix domain-containing protein [bacterium]